MEHERRNNRKSAEKKSSGPKKRNSPAARMARELRHERELEQQRLQEEQRQHRREQRKAGSGGGRSEAASRQERRAGTARQQQPVRKKRDSRGANEAQRRREDRKEQARLDSLRDKQKKKAKHRTRRRISPDTWKRICIMGTVVLAVILTMVIFFRVRNVEVEGNHYYSVQEIVDAADISEGDNLLTLSRGEIAGNIIAKLPYIKSVRVTRSLPDSVVLKVSEHEASFVMQDAAGISYLVTASGKIADIMEDRDAGIHATVTEPLINPAEVGEMVTLVGREGNEKETQNHLNALLLLMQEIEKAELVKQISSIQAASAYKLIVRYEDRFEVRLGNTEQLPYKLEFLKVAVAQQKDYASGIIDLTLNEGNQARVILDE